LQGDGILAKPKQESKSVTVFPNFLNLNRLIIIEKILFGTFDIQSFYKPNFKSKKCLKVGSMVFSHV